MHVTFPTKDAEPAQTPGPIPDGAAIATMPQRMLAVCKKRRWDISWPARGAYLHLEASELIEAVRGKHGDPKEEAGDVLLVLMSITEASGIPWPAVVCAANRKLRSLEQSGPYKGEETESSLNWVRVDNGVTACTEIGRYFVADDGYFTVPADSNRYPCRDVMVGRADCWSHYDTNRTNGVGSTPAAFAWARVPGGWSADTDIGVYHVSDGLVFTTPGSQMAWTCASEHDGKKACSLHYRKAKGDFPSDAKLDWERAAGAYAAKSSEGVYVVHDNCTASFPNERGGCATTVETHGDEDGMNRCEEHLRSRLTAESPAPMALDVYLEHARALHPRLACFERRGLPAMPPVLRSG